MQESMQKVIGFADFSYDFKSRGFLISFLILGVERPESNELAENDRC